MQLITLLLIIVAILTALSGIAVLSGVHKSERPQAILFFLTTMAALGWALGVGIFLSLPADTDPQTVTSIIASYYISAPVMCWGLMAYTCFKYKSGKIGMVLLAIMCATFICIILAKPEMLYDNYTLSAMTGNIVHIRHGVFYIIYGIYHFTAVGLYMLGLWHAAHSSKLARVKRANYMVLAGFTFTGVLALVFDFILPYFGRYDTVWVGILAMSIAWIFHYYAILRYHLLNLSSPWLKGFSHIIVMSLAALIYLVVFFIIFASLFKVTTPTIQVIVLNALMIIAVLLLFPGLNEISSFVDSLSSTDEIDVAYIVKKLTLLVGDEVNLFELSAFLCDHLHFQYIGFVLNDSVCGSKNLRISPDTISRISHLKKSNGGIWLEPNEELSEILQKLDITAVAELRNSKGVVMGQMLFGKSNGHMNFEDRDLVPVEIITQILPAVIHSEKHRIKRHIF